MEGYIDENRWIDLSGLPRKKYGDTMSIDWKNSVGCEMPFKYNKVSGKIKIAKYALCNGQGSTLYITIDKYIPIPHCISAHQLLYCQIKSLVDNRIADNAPHLIKYLKDPMDAYLYSCQSNKSIQIKCPICGYVDTIEVHHLYLEGKECPICGDGISRPEKVVISILNQLGIKYKRQANKSTPGFEWAERYRYDFAFDINNIRYIVETDGGFHRFQYQRDIDNKKDMLAKENGFCMIRIDCSYDGMNVVSYMRDKIANSELQFILDLAEVDWDKCKEDSCNNMMYEACNLWENQGLSSREICLQLNLTTSTVNKYLKYGKEIGLCPTYNTKESHDRGRTRSEISKRSQTYTRHCLGKITRKQNGKPICLLHNGIVIAVFIGGKEAEQSLEKFIGRHYYINSIYRVCSGKRGMANGFDLKYITREEYEQYKMINDFEVVKGDDKYDKCS